MKLDQKVAVITGAGRGIGKAIALKFAREGARVIAADLDHGSAASVAGEIESIGGDALAVKVDVSDNLSVDSMVKEALIKYGKVDILINNAGWDKIGLFMDSSEDTWEKVIAINLKGTIICCKALLPQMMERKYGKILNVSSDAGRVGSSGEVVYSAAKGGVIAFSKALAREMARYKININCLAPGPTDTPLFAEVAADNPKIAEALIKSIPLRRLGQPNDLANAAAFLVSDDAEYITGQTLSVNGGLNML
ncbi:SDR family NAD(P)-dependent oxidoreductase [Desulfotruncus alcoholivorax]|uniref:SDR family NAD(P)-dependent oxidoreductase n=1 Tax=Desulfotruncus alcoholivorax TaxID=265477 RepID=UPI00041A4860|nr:3-oxoacyl-ACP reductase family protein [Desulfotruncus alcoholivorax]